MKINIIAVGKIKEKYLKEAIDEYRKRMSKFWVLDIIEVNESIAKIENDSNIKKSIEDEGKSILSKIKDGYVIVLDIDGKEYSTTELGNKINEIIVFINFFINNIWMS